MNQNQWYKNKGFLLVLALLLVGGFFLFKGEDSDADEEDNTVVEVQAGEVEIKGEIACLYYENATAGQGCVKALKGDDGKMYALNSLAVRGAENEMAVGTKVTAVGKLEKANTSVNDSSVFTYDALLVLSSIQKR